jgi:hypothetical protein
MALFLAGCATASCCLASPDGTGARLTATDRARVQAALTKAVERDDYFKDMPVEAVKLGATDWVDRNGSRRLLVSATVSFKALSNVYCGAAVVDGDLATATLVQGKTPVQDCRRIAGVAFPDANGDGPAIAQEIIVASNRDGADVPFHAVYVPAEGGYCFSPSASEALDGIHPFTAKALQARFDAERTRLKLSRWECGS